MALAGFLAESSVASCPNSAYVGFQTFLAGCGAYERVTPAFKAGARLGQLAIASDGSRVIGESIGVFAGAEGDSFKVNYESVRAGSGWMSSAISPPSSLYPAQEFLDANADLGLSLWQVRSSVESVAAAHLVVREPDGSFIEVGPIISPEAAAGPPAGELQFFANQIYVTYSGASRDLSHVFFQINSSGGPLWPGDTTRLGGGEKSLYEYGGTGNTHPKLVGVNSKGQLISDCGVALGSVTSGPTYNADTYNAVSTSGETVFFTALAGCGALQAPPVNEVYARVGSALGETVAVSEPSAGDCEACQIGAPAPAEFSGASADGSKVFFMTAQELLKGAIGMNLYEYDFHAPAGQKVIQVSTGASESKVLGVARVSDDGTHVYFVAESALTGANAEGSVPLEGLPNLYVFERDAEYPGGRIAFIGTLSASEDEADWNRLDNRPVQATPDGRFLVFQSTANLTVGNTSSVTQVFEYDAEREELVRVSISEPGFVAGATSADEHASTIIRQNYSIFLRARMATDELAVSNDGGLVVFKSAGGLTEQAAPAAEAGLQSVYAYHSAGVLREGRVFSVSDGNGMFAAGAGRADPSGGNVFFETAAPMLGADGDTQFDLYDARESGGFLASVVPKECEKNQLSCQGAVNAPLPSVGFGNVFEPGGGNLPFVKVAHPSVLTPAQKLSKALRACRHRSRRGRRVCEARVRRRHGMRVKLKDKG
ncbi:MAG TPA: hypothetical protein VFY36_10890 [Solirubrobacteraceae bacterium]|nr:hypothetical protein [Solirubrobacteraceae bacterium]